jgi:E3 SUMO-protein ligase RanBP2
VSALLNTNESQSNQWHSSTLQTDPQLDQKKPLSELFKPPTDSWQCEVCYVQNNMSESSCIACQSPNPNITLPTPQQTDQGFKLANVEHFSFKPAFTSSAIGFNFGGINSNNSVFSNNTFKFGNSVTNNPLPSFNLNNFSQPNQVLDQSSQNKFSINSKIDNTDKNAEITDKSVSFQFGLSRKFDFKFADIPPEDNLKSPKSPSGLNTSQEVEDENSSAIEHPEPSNADNIYFQPVVPLPPKVEVKTGEETEDLLYSCRARLFRFASSEWKERGVGELKILLSPNSGKVRLVMRRDTVLKVCLNQYITRELKLDLKEDKKSITWSAIDCSEDIPTPELFLLRLKNPENAGLFLEAFKSAQLLVKETPVKEAIEVKSQESPSKPLNDKSDDIEIVYMKMPESEEHLKKVTELKLPLNFYDYEKMPPCPGCRGCSDEVPAHKPIRQLSNDESLTNKSQDSVQESKC